MKITLIVVVAIAALAYAEADVVSDTQGADVRTDYVSPNVVSGIGEKLNRRQKRSLFSKKGEIIEHAVEKMGEAKKDINEKKVKGIKNVGCDTATEKESVDKTKEKVKDC